ncbi:MAG: SIR2 family protein, partial [Rhodospirillaceae bacterium]|nr:SIR2 family protein [Rhodospirillaceae bacterium]
MRFLPLGPSIPDELLIARDEGRVVFFCGAGVSKARAKLPNFNELAKSVLEWLRAAPDSLARKLLKEVDEIDARIGVTGLISADRIFGLLEREFALRDIREAVARALRPTLPADLRAHKALLRLATTPERRVRLVTTNFDRLFSDCSPHCGIWEPPRLPEPSRPNEFDGIVHLHGRVNEVYRGAEAEGFILSSADFGRAYLSDAWAVRFFKDVIERYVVVFVGYAADDPPVQYLLEALNRKVGELGNAFAFQSGKLDEAVSRWQHKGVQAIAYENDGGHERLWETLEAWAGRA